MLPKTGSYCIPNFIDCKEVLRQYQQEKNSLVMIILQESFGFEEGILAGAFLYVFAP